MTSLTRMAVHWPVRVLVAWLAAAALLTVIGAPLEKKLDPPQLVLPGGSAAAAQAISNGHFGEDTIVLLTGTPTELDLHGPGITTALARRTGAGLVSPWSAGGNGSGPLRPKPGVALIVLDLAPRLKFVPNARLNAFDRIVAQTIGGRIHATVTGPAPLREAITNQSLDAADAAEKIAIPSLLLVLLLVFRSVVAAAIPLIVAGVTVAGGRGVLVLLAHVVHLDATSAVLLSMIGLALGVDYSLLIVTRFREEKAHGEAPGHAVTVAAHTAGRTASFAGLVLSAILGVTLLLAPPGALTSAVVGAIVATMLSVTSALIAAPALLMLLSRWIAPLPEEREGLLGRIVSGALAHPRRGLLAAVPLILLALAGLRLATVPPDPRVLPSDSAGGRELAALAQAGFGPGFEVDLYSPAGPLTAPATLSAERTLEAGIRQIPSVKAVAGAGSLGGAPPTAADLQLDALLRDTQAGQLAVNGLAAGLSRAQGDQVNGPAFRPALAAASAGARGAAADFAAAGADARRLGTDSGLLTANASRTLAGAQTLLSTLRGRLLPGLGGLSGALASGSAGLSALQDPAASTAQRAQASLGAGLAQSQNTAAAAVRSTQALVGGTRTALAEDRALGAQTDVAAQQLAVLEHAAGSIEGQLGNLPAGGLSATLRMLRIRAATLNAGLGRTLSAQPALGQALTTVETLAAGAAADPTLPHSGFTLLASADNTTGSPRAAVRYVLDIDGGGGSGRIVVLTDLGRTDSRTAGVLHRIQALARRFDQLTGARAAVGGQAAQQLEFSNATKSRLPLIVIGVALITFIALVVVLRSLLLAAIAVGLNLLTVATMFGVLTLLFVGKHPVLGAAGALDVITTVSMFAICFALSIDYQVFLLARMREGFVMSQDHIYAIRFGVEHTARIVTGAALIMLGVFAAFATTDVSSVQQFGIGLGIAIVFDATLVRLVLLPSILSLAGRRAWWLPDRMERGLPELDVEGVGFVRSRSELGTRAAEVW